MVVVLVEGVEHQLHLVPDLELFDTDPGDDLAHHHHLLGRQLDGSQAKGT